MGSIKTEYPFLYSIISRWGLSLVGTPHLFFTNQGILMATANVVPLRVLKPEPKLTELIEQTEVIFLDSSEGEIRFYWIDGKLTTIKDWKNQLREVGYQDGYQDGYMSSRFHWITVLLLVLGILISVFFMAFFYTTPIYREIGESSGKDRYKFLYYYLSKDLKFLP
ncbi:hypothetical protein LCGC14_1077800 [marine sediment metagenome]|uniref:Uncharacterized protein n=1 Tax=marine sediment metagenome TaxID=412755 RepID=A0A0F9QM11_9ZZZZ